MDSQLKQAWLTSLRLLTATPKSRRDLSKKLLDKGYPEAVVQETLDQLEKQGFLSDLTYAKNLVSRLTHEKPSGRRKISFELKRRGVPAKIQEELLAEIDSTSESQKALELAEAKWQSWARLPDEKRRKRLYDYLMRRGFDFQIARETLEHLESNIHED